MSVTDVLNMVAAIVTILGFFGITFARGGRQRGGGAETARGAGAGTPAAGAVTAAPPSASPPAFQGTRIIKAIGFTLLALLALGNDLGGPLLFGFLAWVAVRWLKGPQVRPTGGAGWMWLKVSIVVVGVLFSVAAIVAAIEEFDAAPAVGLYPEAMLSPYGAPVAPLYPAPPMPWYPPR